MIFYYTFAKLSNNPTPTTTEVDPLTTGLSTFSRDNPAAVVAVTTPKPIAAVQRLSQNGLVSMQSRDGSRSRQKAVSFEYELVENSLAKLLRCFSFSLIAGIIQWLLILKSSLLLVQQAEMQSALCLNGLFTELLD